jgi:predicted transcriptional regulator
MLEKALKDKRHQALHFHEIEENWVKNWIKGLVYGANLNIKTGQLLDLLERLQSLREIVWVATIIDILKYEEERKQARIESIVEKGSVQKIRIAVKTDPELYDHPLTLVAPMRQGMVFDRAEQNGKTVSDARVTSKGIMLNIKPMSSDILIYRSNK